MHPPLSSTSLYPRHTSYQHRPFRPRRSLPTQMVHSQAARAGNRAPAPQHGDLYPYDYIAGYTMFSHETLAETLQALKRECGEQR